MTDDHETAAPSEPTATAPGGSESPPAATLSTAKTRAVSAPDAEPGDWATKITDNIDAVVTAVHDKLVRPLLIVVRAALYGAIITAMLAMIVLLACIATIRLLYVYGPWSQVWPVYVLLGGVLCAAGGVLFYLARGTRTAAGPDGS